jgi:hypothetical protein
MVVIVVVMIVVVHATMTPMHATRASPFPLRAVFISVHWGDGINILGADSISMRSDTNPVTRHNNAITDMFSHHKAADVSGVMSGG